MVKEAIRPRTSLQVDAALATVPLEQERSFVSWQRDIPREYWRLTAPELRQRIATAKRNLGKRAVIPGHHYQRDDVIRFADYRGDSLKLAQMAAANSEAEYIVFCGVHFMAESADILSAPGQKVILPNLAAGCLMADMASVQQVESCWAELTALWPARDVVPVTYINSTAALKAFCGRNGGAVCTSSNAPAVLRWAFERGRRVLFFPDQHLGRITALDMGVPPEELTVWDYRLPLGYLGGNSREEVERARVLLWKGHCGIHQRFTMEHVREARERHPDARVVVHPECRLDVIRAADAYGSTEHIIKLIESSPPGSAWAVGTEINLVNRLAHENPDKTVFSLHPTVVPCPTMRSIHPAYLCWVLERLLAGEVVNQVSVEAETGRQAKVALDRMLSV